MTTPIHAIVVAVGLAFAGSAIAQDATPSPSRPDPISSVARSAEERLEKSIAELNTLREQIAAEKLPMSQQISALEERLTELRKENDQVTRLVDAGALEMAQIRQGTKARQDELTYVGNLLDEFARNFETRVNVGESQVLGSAIASVKDAPENKSLSVSERLALQTGLVNTAIRRLDDAVGGMKFKGTGVDMSGTVSEGEFAMIGPVALFRAASGAAGVAVAQQGSERPLIRPLEGDMQSELSTLIATGEGTLPLDPSRGAALKALVQKTNLVHIFIKGGPIMWPILAASLVALAVVLERVIFLLNEGRKRSRKAMNRFFGEVEKGNLAAAIEVSKQTKDCVVNTLGYALEHRDQSLTEALTYSQNRALSRFRRGIAVLDTIITLAPLLGLLGTVAGMMGSFAVIGGDLSSPGAITGGIAEALIATAAGLGIAITCLLPFNYLNAKIEAIETELATAAAHLKLLVEGDAGSKPRSGHSSHAVSHGAPHASAHPVSAAASSGGA
jgi:biopolymer transport protein ExbB